MEVKARYWGIGRVRAADGSSTRIGEVEIYEAELDETEMSNISGGATSLYSADIAVTALTPSLLESVDGDLSTQQVITQDATKTFGIAVDCTTSTAVRCIVLRNVNDKPPESFIPFAVDSLDYFVGGEINTGKIRRYSVMKLEADDTINLVYTILPLSDAETPSIVQSIVQSVTKGVCQ